MSVGPDSDPPESGPLIPPQWCLGGPAPMGIGTGPAVPRVWVWGAGHRRRAAAGVAAPGCDRPPRYAAVASRSTSVSVREAAVHADATAQPTAGRAHAAGLADPLLLECGGPRLGGLCVARPPGGL